MGINIETLVAAKKFTSETVLGGGAVVGKNVTISSITPIEGGNKVTFSYTLDNGTVKTSTMDVMDGKDGVSVTGASDKGDGTFTLLLSDGSETDPIQTIKGQKGDKGNTGDKGDPGKDGVTAIDDTKVSTVSTYSSSKIEQKIASIPSGGTDNNMFKTFVEEQLLHEQSIQHNTMIPYYKSYEQGKGVITLVIDDCVLDFANIAQCYLEANIPVCVAYIGNKDQLSKNVDEAFWGKSEITVKEVIDRLVANGGEVLCHHGEVMTQDKLEDFDTCFEHFVDCKRRYEQDGNWEINGIILAGGNGQVVGSPISDKWVRSNFLYSDLYGEAEYKEPYYHYRSNMSNFTLDSLKADITNTVNLGRWEVRYQHAFSEFSKENLQALLSWINEQNILVKTYKEVYNDLISYDIPNVKADMSNYYTKDDIDAMLSGTWDETIEYTFTDGRDQAYSQATVNFEAGKTYTLSFDYKVDATDCSANGITLYNWSMGLEDGISFSPHGVIEGTKTITLTPQQTKNNISAIVIDDRNQGSASLGSLKLYIKNFKFEEI